MPPWGIVGRIVLAYVHSQMNPQTCTEFGVNRSIRLIAFPDLNLWPPKTPRNAPCGIEGWIAFSYVYSQTNPQTCTKCCTNRSSSLIASPDIWICDPLTPPNVPWGIVGRLVFSIYVHFQMNPQTWTKVGANRSGRLTASPDFWMFDPLKPPKCPLVSIGAFCLAYNASIHSQINLHMCAKFGVNRSSRLVAFPVFMQS